ncbi:MULTISPECIES: hypothetical protein [Paenibacillus]|uniref:Methyltransferase n=1 Tax=Paenibacillus campinasensis TaxID=66347 RepID=A0ABW9SYL8_9BACL|nr:MULTISPECIES: hypothetical protein [Paenibacillus]MUG65927.1 hypothetical protein [Paenibacillus campinasensis]PAK51718.1 hypothetical protein CHH75_14220 [Paenibacillus sp. 7541]
MSRSWERKVNKNMAQLNKQRKKQGLSGYQGSGTAGSADIFRGRKYVLPIILLALAALYALLGTFTTEEGQSNSVLNWVGVSLYILLAVMIFLRKPYLKVEKAAVSTFKFNRERRLNVSEIEKILIADGSVVIQGKGRGGNWVFSRLINRYDTKAMGERLEEFAKVHHIPVERS